MYERQLAATAQFIFTINGADGFSFSPIVGAGKNSCYLHYKSNSKQIESNDIIVMDFGADYRYYASDITRTFPASGKFSPEQRKAYEITLEAQKAAIEKVRPGMSFDDVWSAARSVLYHYGVMDNMPHGVSHYVGMSVHDVGKNERFVPGVVITVEPGIYFPEVGMGVRIEDTVLVTENGCEILTKDAPKEISEIENLMVEKGIATIQ
jgi:Xaa-Pro aminopeptidase